MAKKKKKVARKTATKSKKSAEEVKRERDERIIEAGKGTRFQPGNPGGPGRPRKEKSVRDSLREFAGQPCPKHLLERIANQLPYDAEKERAAVMGFTFAQAMAYQHLLDGIDGDERIRHQSQKQAYLQVDGPVLDQELEQPATGPLQIVIVDKREVTPEMMSLDPPGEEEAIDDEEETA